MENGGSSFVFLSWQCEFFRIFPDYGEDQRSTTSKVLNGLLSDIPIDVYEEIFSWLRPCVDLDMDWDSQQTIFARLACVCRYFAYYATCEMCYYLHFDGGERFPKPKPPTPTGPWFTGIIKRLQPMETPEFSSACAFRRAPG